MPVDAGDGSKGVQLNAPTDSNLRDTGASVNSARIQVTHGQISGMQTMEGLNVGAAKGAAVGEIFASQGIRYNGFREGAGTAFPTNPAPAAGDRFFRTDLGWLCYYDGTRWLTAHELVECWPMLSAAAPFNGGVSFGRTRGDYASWFTRVSVTTGLGSPNDASNYWWVLVYSATTMFSAATQVYAYNTIGDGVNVNTAHDGVASPQNPANYGAVYVQLTSVGTPGGLNLFFSIYYRLIVT